jgi:DMSO/TMAO reductase YedYZ molybdopterin-dependent catalytic subunit
MNRKSELIKHSESPEAFEFPLEALDGPITPNELFFIRSHFETPIINGSQWCMVVEGCVECSKSFSLDDLKAMPKTSVEAVLECAGNGRSELETPVPGLQWGRGAVGNAVWSGVAVKTVLEAVGISDQAVDVVFQGADKGVISNPQAPPGEVAYARSIPRELALAGDAILAYEMNGVPLSPSHGFPVRLVVPGWYGAASVKWVTRVLAVDHAFGGYYQTTDYSYWEIREGLPELKPIGAMPVKSVIAVPTSGAKVKCGERLNINGAAWTGCGDVTRVEVSLDRGLTWSDADLADLRTIGSWRLWSFQWVASGPAGSRSILARATDSHGRIQPAVRNGNCHSYIIDHSSPVDIQIVVDQAG